MKYIRTAPTAHLSLTTLKEHKQENKSEIDIYSFISLLLIALLCFFWVRKMCKKY